MADNKAKSIFDQYAEPGEQEIEVDLSDVKDKHPESDNKAKSIFDQYADDDGDKIELQEEDPRGLSPLEPTESTQSLEDIKGDLSKDLSYAVEAGGRGAIQGATLGSSDEIGAFLTTLSLDEEYKKERDAIREANKAAQEKHPIIYGGMEIGGGLLPSMALPGGQAGIATKLAVGAGLGAAGAAGYTETDPREDPAQFTEELGKGALLGAGGVGLGEMMAPAQSIVGTVGRTAGAGALGAGMGAVIDDEDPTRGALLGGAAGAGARGLLGVTRQLLDQEALKKAAKYTRQGENLSKTPESVAKYNKDLDDVAHELQKLANKGTKVKSNELAQGLKAIEKKLDDFITKTKTASGKNIEAVRNQLRGHAVETRGLVDDINKFLDDSFAPEEIKNQIRQKLAKVTEFALPENAISRSVTTKFDPETGEFVPVREVNKVAGKKVSVDELDTLRQMGPYELGDASSTDTYTPKGIRRTEVQKYNIGGGKALKDASIEELVDLKYQLAQGLNSPDPKEAALFKQAYGKVSRTIEGMITDEAMLARYQQANALYSKASEMDKSLFNRAGDLSIEDQILGYNAGKVNTAHPEINNKLDQLRALERAEAGTVGMADDIQQTIGQTSTVANEAKALEPLANPATGAQAAKTQILSMADEFNRGPVDSNLKLLRTLEPEATASVETKAQRIADIADLLDLNKEGFNRDVALPAPTVRGFANKLTESRKAGSVEIGKMVGSTQRAFDKLLTKVENLPVLARVAETKGFNKFAQLLKKAASKDAAGRAMTLWLIQNDAGYRKQLEEIKNDLPPEIEAWANGEEE